MTPKQKANQLIEKFKFCDEGAERFSAKSCAQILVSEILDVWENQQPRRFEEWLSIDDYWRQVRREISIWTPDYGV